MIDRLGLDLPCTFGCFGVWIGIGGQSAMIVGVARSSPVRSVQAPIDSSTLPVMTNRVLHFRIDEAVKYAHR